VSARSLVAGEEDEWKGADSHSMTAYTIEEWSPPASLRVPQGILRRPSAVVLPERLSTTSGITKTEEEVQIALQTLQSPALPHSLSIATSWQEPTSRRSFTSLSDADHSVLSTVIETPTSPTGAHLHSTPSRRLSASQADMIRNLLDSDAPCDTIAAALHFASRRPAESEPSTIVEDTPPAYDFKA